ncbi:valine--tRNA ligase-like [Liolophura sinensis]|uniref:valine--tRNA ligase-like n=1 Tax=Liolophura sinensis TaxID=3198878 RepID=UPI00315869CC
MSASWSVMRFLYFRHKIKYFKSRRHHICFNPNAYRSIQCGIRHSSYTASLSRLLNKNDNFELASVQLPRAGRCANSVITDKRGPASVTHRQSRSFHFSQTTQDSSKKTKVNKPSREKDVVTYDVKTPKGEKKDTNCPLPTGYSPLYVEAAWYDWWVKEGFFKPDTRGSDISDPFVICLPPPNVTGNLHLGHALTNSIQDAIVRWHRMKGETTLWVPGCDHAGIATQVVVEKKLWREKQLTRHDLGREHFIEEIWKWKNEKGEVIYDQMKKLGSSLDWERAKFTLDEPMNKAVTEAFVQLHDAGLIYRSDRLVHWCCHLKSTISDIEVENMELSGRTLLDVPGYQDKVEFGLLHSFAYPVEGSDEEVVVATTRLETMLGDTAVCVHPEDDRFSHLHGKFVTHPFEDRRLPIIQDEFVDKSYGTGAVKLTPAHDHKDYDVGRKHGLPMVTILADDGRLTNVSAEFQGMKRFEAREALIQSLSQKGLFRGTCENPMVLPLCSRSHDVIEPRLKEQWFVSCKEMAQQALEAVRSGELEIHPAMYQSDWYNWLGDIRDWCVSRQLWWGHRIPAYLAKTEVDNRGQWVCAESEASARTKAAQLMDCPPGEIVLQQDEDVLDTWFSSALFPFAVFGWPDKTDSLCKFYPTSLLETGHDILFFWVARMVMLGQKLTGELPFKQVLLHGTLRDAHGRKMSKSLGNVVDPVDIIRGISLDGLQKQLLESNLSKAEIKKAMEGQRSDYPEGIPECGTDALRFTLCSYNFKAQEINMDVTHVKSYRHFCNKIWQAFKFVTMNLGENFQPRSNFKIQEEGNKVDQWIVSRLCHMVQSCDQSFRSHDLHWVTKSLHQFWYMDLCNVYLESVKPVLWDLDSPHRDVVNQTLWLCVNTALRATSPFMPFLTEELYQRLPRSPESLSRSICIAPYPEPSEYPWRNLVSESEMDTVLQIVNKSLSIKKEFNIGKMRPQCFVQITEHNCDLHELEHYRDVISTLSRCDNTQFVESRSDIPDGCVANIVNQHYTVHLLLKNLLNPDVEKTRLQKRLEKVIASLEKVTASQEKRGSKTSPDIQQRYMDKALAYRKEIGEIQATLKTLDKFR